MKELLEKLGYTLHANGSLVNLKKLQFEFLHKDGYYLAYNDNARELFCVPDTLSLGTALVLFQEFRIIHERYIYETVEGIEEMFKDNE